MCGAEGLCKHGSAEAGEVSLKRWEEVTRVCGIKAFLQSLAKLMIVYSLRLCVKDLIDE